MASQRAWPHLGEELSFKSDEPVKDEIGRNQLNHPTQFLD
jgi:hypothetical protein